MTDHEPVSVDVADGLGDLLHLLAGYPSPQATLGAIIEGPLQELGAWAGLMWIERDGYLEAVAGYNLNGAVDELYARIAVDADMPVPLCFRESEVIVTDVRSMGSVFQPLAAHQEAWDDFVPAGRICTLVQIPMVSRGVSLGVVGIVCTEVFTLDTLTISFLDGIGAALGLWVTHPSTRLPDGVALVSNRPANATVTSLSARQQRIVLLIRQGRANAAIAVELGCSVSTVKQEIQRIQRGVQASDRTEAAARAIALGLLSD